MGLWAGVSGFIASVSLEMIECTPAFLVPSSSMAVLRKKVRSHILYMYGEAERRDRSWNIAKVF